MNFFLASTYEFSGCVAIHCDAGLGGALGISAQFGPHENEQANEASAGENRPLDKSGRRGAKPRHGSTYVVHNDAAEQERRKQ